MNNSEPTSMPSGVPSKLCLPTQPENGVGSLLLRCRPILMTLIRLLPSWVVAMGPAPRGVIDRGGWGDLTVSKEAALSVFNMEPATRASLWRTHTNPQVSWLSGQGETCQGELDQLIQEECGDWVFWLLEEGKEPNPTRVCLRPSCLKFVQGSSGCSDEL